MWTVDVSESVLRAWLHGRTFDFRVHGPSSGPLLTFFYFSVFFLNLKLPIMLFSHFVIQFNIKTFGKIVIIRPVLSDELLVYRGYYTVARRH